LGKYGASAVEPPFGKNKGLIQSTLEELESEVKSEARAAYCDRQVPKTKFKRGELEDDNGKRTSKVYRTSARWEEYGASAVEPPLGRIRGLFGARSINWKHSKRTSKIYRTSSRWEEYGASVVELPLE
jgi:hypothetical protein